MNLPPKAEYGLLYLHSEIEHGVNCKECADKLKSKLIEKLASERKGYIELLNKTGVAAKRIPPGVCPLCNDKLFWGLTYHSPYFIFGHFNDEDKARVNHDWRMYGNIGEVGGVYGLAGSINAFEYLINCKKCGVMSHYFFDSSFRSYLQDGNNLYQSIHRGMSAEAAGRSEDAGRFYEMAGKLEWAKDARREAKTQYVKQTTVDINALLKFFQENNYTIPYKCPSCHGTIKLSKERAADKFLTCEYCGTSLQAIDIQNIVNQFM